VRSAKSSALQIIYYAFRLEWKRLKTLFGIWIRHYHKYNFCIEGLSLSLFIAANNETFSPSEESKKIILKCTVEKRPSGVYSIEVSECFESFVVRIVHSRSTFGTHV
jgi:hypothetical protein